MSLDRRLQSIERTFQPIIEGAKVLVFRPESWLVSPDGPAPIERDGGRQMSVGYPLDMEPNHKGLCDSLETLIPPGPDHDRLVKHGQNAQTVIVVSYIDRSIDGEVVA